MQWRTDNSWGPQAIEDFGAPGLTDGHHARRQCRGGAAKISDISGTDVKKNTDLYILSLVLLSLATLMGPPSGMGPSLSASMVSPPLGLGHRAADQFQGHHPGHHLEHAGTVTS